MLNSRRDFDCRYSGELREIGVQIDEIANFLWENVSIAFIVVVSVFVPVVYKGFVFFTEVNEVTCECGPCNQ